MNFFMYFMYFLAGKKEWGAEQVFLSDEDTTVSYLSMFYHPIFSFIRSYVSFVCQFLFSLWRKSAAQKTITPWLLLPHQFLLLFPLRFKRQKSRWRRLPNCMSTGRTSGTHGISVHRSMRYAHVYRLVCIQMWREERSDSRMSWTVRIGDCNYDDKC